MPERSCTRVRAPRRAGRLPLLRARPAPSFSIVGVGASAGGFEAFAQFLEGLPRDPNLAIIFVQHLAPHHSSSLASLLANHTPLAVLEATEGARIVPNRVYVVPPNTQMELIDGHLHLGRRPEDRSQYNPIDFFFRSLARALGAHAIGVVLSGHGIGRRARDSRDQDDGRHHVRAGSVDGEVRRNAEGRHRDADGRCRGLARPTIAPKVTQISTHPYLTPLARARRRDRRSRTSSFAASSGCCFPACGVNFSHYKTPTIIRRLFRRMALLRMVDAEAYIAYLEQTPAEVVNLHNDLLIHVTRFFREPDSFEFIAREVLPSIDLEPGKPLRMWVAGCATGEEVYSLAMVVHEVLRRTARAGARADFRNGRQRKRRGVRAPWALSRPRSQRTCPPSGSAHSS